MDNREQGRTKKTIVNNNPAAMSTAKRKSQPVRRMTRISHFREHIGTPTSAAHFRYLDVQRSVNGDVEWAGVKDLEENDPCRKTDGATGG